MAIPVSRAAPEQPPLSSGQQAGPFWQEPLYWLLAALPAAVALAVLDAGPLWVFAASALAIVPLAGLLGRATEGLAETLGPGAGGLLNATFGNAAELILALMALRQGPALYPLVKASITGSIIGNLLLVLGLAILAGGLRYERQVFNRTAAGMGATLLALASVGLLLPALYSYILQAEFGLGAAGRADVVYLSREIAAVLAVIYLLSLVFSLRTHRRLYDSAGEGRAEAVVGPEWSPRLCLAVLVLATAGIAGMSELLVETVEPAARQLGLGRVFIGVIVVAVIGNAAEHSTAVQMALRNKMDLAFHVAVGSGIQVALFVAPVLVFASMAMGHSQSLDLHFSLLETAAVALAVGLLALVCHDGETHWMEGVMLLGLYLILALAFYHLPEPLP